MPSISTQRIRDAINKGAQYELLSLCDALDETPENYLT